MPLLRRRPRRGRRLRRLFMLGGAIGAIAAYRNKKLAENDARYGSSGSDERAPSDQPSG